MFIIPRGFYFNQGQPSNRIAGTVHCVTGCTSEGDLRFSDLNCVMKPVNRLHMLFLNEYGLLSVSCEYGIDISKGACIKTYSEGVICEAGSFELVRPNFQ